MEQTHEYISKDDLISGIVDKYGMDAAEIMLKYGLHCVGCHVSQFETIEQGCLGHGMPEDDFNSMLKELNDMAKEHPSSNNNPETNDDSISPKKGSCCSDTSTGNCASDVSQEKDVVVPLNDKDPVFVTEAASEKAKSLMEGEDKALLVQVIPGGCSGFQYDLSFSRPDIEGDITYVTNGLKVIIGKGSLQYIKGAEIDFIDTLNASGFKIKNPNAQSKCGCGKSFN